MNRKSAATLLLALSTSAGATFTYVAKADPITDANHSLIYTDGLEDEDTTLFVQCREDGLNVVVDPDDYLGDEVSGLYRFDKLAASSMFDWDAATDGTAAFLPSEKLRAFMAQARKSKTLTVWLYDDNGTPTTLTFNLSGLAASLQKLPCAKGY